MFHRASQAVAIVAASLMVLHIGGVRAAEGGSTGAPPAAGLYTEAQAERGKALYAGACALCHGPEMGGGPAAPALTGPEFQFGWNGRSVGELLEYVHKNMPPGQAGSLTDQQYADVVAAMLKTNNLLAGTTELPVEIDQNQSTKLILAK